MRSSSQVFSFKIDNSRFEFFPHYMELGQDLLNDDYYMYQALREARKAARASEVPIGAVIVKDGVIIARGWNQVETLKDATAHAEMIALTAAQAHHGDWRLEGATVYVTKEPCPMCAGALVHCRPDRVVYGVKDPKGGAAGGWINLLQSNPPLNHYCEITTGVLESECLEVLQTFFRKAREEAKLKKKLRRLEEAEQAEEE